MANMSMREAARFFEIEMKALREMQRDGFLGKEIFQDEVNNLSFLQCFWKNKKYLRYMLSQFTPGERKKLIEGKPLSKVEQYIHSRYSKREGQLLVTTVMDEICARFHLESTPALYTKIQNIRKLARKDKRKTSAKRKCEDD